MGHFKNIQIDQMNQDELLEYQHNSYINQVAESGLPLYICDMYNHAYFPIESSKEVNNRNSAKTGESDDLPF